MHINKCKTIIFNSEIPHISEQNIVERSFLFQLQIFLVKNLLSNIETFATEKVST